MDHEHHRRLRFHFGINNEGLDRAVAMLQIDPFTVARRLFSRSFAQSWARVVPMLNAATKQPKSKSAKFHASTERRFRMVGN